ncbi:MAG TPA: glycosyltransferase family 2 protein [Candidatus Eisenbacteria bacterium]|nr:glycosyltransferase family 2 protein [Candidatus Eisenbacteria bacterium]
MTQLSSLSIFFPFWNEEKNIEKVVLSAIPTAKKIARTWEILIVDDGSSDATLQLAQKLAKKDNHIRVINHSKNRGYGAALKSGFENAKYEYIVFVDGDGQFDFSEVEKFISPIATSDIVIGNRKKRLDHPFRHVLMNLLKIWDFIFFGFYFKDIDCGFKMFRKSAVKKILPLSSEGAMITTEILAKAIRAKLKISQVDVIHYPRKAGNQSGGNVRVISRAIRESFALWKELYGRT